MATTPAELGWRCLAWYLPARGWRVEEFDAIQAADPALAQVIEAPSDAELAALYLGCLFTVYPSYYEGWGLPVGESVWFGKYCVAANSSALPEVCGDLIDYADPHDPADLAKKLRRALTEPGYVRSKELAIRHTVGGADRGGRRHAAVHCLRGAIDHTVTPPAPGLARPPKGRLTQTCPSSLDALVQSGQLHCHAVRSVLAQDDPDWQLWVLDNSTDSTPEVMKQFTDPRIRFRHVPNADPGSCSTGCWRMRVATIFLICTPTTTSSPAMRLFRKACRAATWPWPIAICMSSTHKEGELNHHRGAFDLPRLLSLIRLAPFGHDRWRAGSVASVSRMSQMTRFCIPAYGQAEFIYLRTADRVPAAQWQPHCRNRRSSGMRNALLRVLPKVLTTLEHRGLQPRQLIAIK
jgi:hypothetical protein